MAMSIGWNPFFKNSKKTIVIKKKERERERNNLMIQTNLKTQ